MKYVSTRCTNVIVSRFTFCGRKKEVIKNIYNMYVCTYFFN